MQTADRSWLPASPRERVFLFSLSLSLMLNTTVVLLLVTGDLPVLADLRAQPATALAEQPEQDDPAGARSHGTAETVAPPHAEPRPAHTGTATPPKVATRKASPRVSDAAEVSLPEPIEALQQAKPTDNAEPPIEFFGIGIE